MGRAKGFVGEEEGLEILAESIDELVFQGFHASIAC